VTDTTLLDLPYFTVLILAKVLKMKDLELKKLSPEKQKLILANSISPLPLHKTLVLFECLKQFEDEPFYRHALLALGNVLVFKLSNLHFGPEVGVRKPKVDVPVVVNWLLEIDKMANDLRQVAGKSFPETKVHLADARTLDILELRSVDAVITSPPTPMKRITLGQHGSSRFYLVLSIVKKN
jgi:hypothetical protein